MLAIQSYRFKNTISSDSRERQMTIDQIHRADVYLQSIMLSSSLKYYP